MLKLSFVLTLVAILSVFLISGADAQFFFPFGMGANSNGFSNYNYGGTVYGSRNGVKDAEGFFVICKGWTCQS